MEAIEIQKDQMDKSAKTLGTMLDYLGLEATVKPQQQGSQIILATNSEESGRIIGRKGQSLESLQLLINRMMQKNDPDFPKIIIDVDGYTRAPLQRQRGKERDVDSSKTETLRQQALDAAKEVKRWGESVTLPAMNAHDRRIVHITLREDNEVLSESEGEGSLKKIIVSLKNS